MATFLQSFSCHTLDDMTTIESEQLQKDVLWELHAATQSVDEHRAKLAKILRHFEEVSGMLAHKLNPPPQVQSQHIHRHVDQGKIETLPSSADVLNALDELKGEEHRLQDARQQADRLNIKTKIRPTV